MPPLLGVGYRGPFAHHRPWCWVATVFLTLPSGMSLDHLPRWDTHRTRMLRLINRPGLWRIDCAPLVLGCGFAALAVFVY